MLAGAGSLASADARGSSVTLGRSASPKSRK
jgi:hypothetical protein